MATSSSPNAPGYTLHEAARALGVHPPQVARFLRQNYVPGASRLPGPRARYVLTDEALDFLRAHGVGTTFTAAHRAKISASLRAHSHPVDTDTDIETGRKEPR